MLKITISENQIDTREEEFAKLCKYVKLHKITLDANPYFDISWASPKTEVIIQMETLQKLIFVNKEQITKEDYEEVAKTLKEIKEKKEEEIKKRRRRKIEKGRRDKKTKKKRRKNKKRTRRRRGQEKSGGKEKGSRRKRKK